MMESIVKPTPTQVYPVHDSAYLKANYKTEFTNALKEIRVYLQGNQLSDQDFRVLFSALLASYVGCLVETEFETKMSRWSDRLFSHWLRY